MRKPVPDYIAAHNQLFRYFNCPTNYPVRTETNAKWFVREVEDVCFLTLLTEGKREDFVVVRRTDEPLLFTAADYTMVVAIDCVKFAFILRNGNRQEL